MAPINTIFLVCFGIHQIVQFGGVGDLNFNNQASPNGSLLTNSGVFDRASLTATTFPETGLIDIRSSFNRFDGGNSRAFLDRLTYGRVDFYKDDVRKLVLRVIRDTQGGNFPSTVTHSSGLAYFRLAGIFIFFPPDKIEID